MVIMQPGSKVSIPSGKPGYVHVAYISEVSREVRKVAILVVVKVVGYT